MLFSFKNKYHYTYLNTYIAIYFSYPKVTCNTHTQPKEFCFHPSYARSLVSLTTTPLLTPFHWESSLHTPKQRKGKLCWHKVENQVVYQDTTNPTKNVHCRSRPANRSQIGAEPEKGNQLQDTLRKTAGAPGKGTAATPEEAQQEPTPHPAGGEEEDTALPSQKETPHTHRDHQRWRHAAKTHKASYCKIEISGE